MFNPFIHHRQSYRLKAYDYRKPGLYYVTLNTRNSEHYFGHVENGEIILSGIGEIAFFFWIDIAKHNSNVKIHAFVIMPDHIHGIVELIDNLEFSGRDVACNVPTRIVSNEVNSKTVKDEYMSSISPKSGSLSAIMRSYKSAVTKCANDLYPELNFEWQSRFYDHIIRSTKEYHRIVQYIKNNPAKWK